MFVLTGHDLFIIIIRTIINAFISHKIKTTYLMLHTFHSKKRNLKIIKKIINYKILSLYLQISLLIKVFLKRSVLISVRALFLLRRLLLMTLSLRDLLT